MHIFSKTLGVLAFLFTFVVGSPVPATVVRFDLNGVYTTGTKVGQSLSATISYENTQTPTLFLPFSNANENYYIIPTFAFTNAINMPAVEDALNIGVQDALNSSQGDGFIFNLSQISFNFFSGYQSFSGPTVPTINMLTLFNKTFNYYGSTAGSGTFTITPVITQVPEPVSWALIVIGLGIVGVTLRNHDDAEVLLAK